MEAQSGFDTFVEATRYLFRGPSPRELLILVVVFLLFSLSIAIPFLYMKISRRRELKRIFFSHAKDYDLTQEEAELLWRYASKLPINPLLVFEKKVIFEKVVDEIVKKGEPEEIKMIPVIRMKLRYDTLPWFIPLSTTRDIDIYQTGTLIVGEYRTEAYVYDKDEEYIYIALMSSIPVKVGDKVKFFFVRENDARYSFEGEVEKIFSEAGRTVIALRHTDKITRIQLRESIRWKVEIPARFRFGENLQALSQEEYEGIIEDISVRGVRLCYSGNLPLKEGDFVLLDFSLRHHDFKGIIGRVMYKKVYERKTCYGIKFEDITRKEEQIIEQFILEEQRKLLRAYKLGET
ncbi:flagellar brake protein [Aquifex sp.]